MFKVLIFTTEGLLHSDLAQEVSIPAEEEQMSILDFHQPMIVCLGKGEINIDGKKSLNISEGIAHFDNQELKMLVGLS